MPVLRRLMVALLPNDRLLAILGAAHAYFDRRPYHKAVYFSLLGLLISCVTYYASVGLFPDFSKEHQVALFSTCSLVLGVPLALWAFQMPLVMFGRFGRAQVTIHEMLHDVLGAIYTGASEVVASDPAATLRFMTEIVQTATDRNSPITILCPYAIHIGADFTLEKCKDLLPQGRVFEALRSMEAGSRDLRDLLTKHRSTLRIISPDFHLDRVKAEEKTLWERLWKSSELKDFHLVRENLQQPLRQSTLEVITTLVERRRSLGHSTMEAHVRVLPRIRVLVTGEVAILQRLPNDRLGFLGECKVLRAGDPLLEVTRATLDLFSSPLPTISPSGETP